MSATRRRRRLWVALGTLVLLIALVAAGYFPQEPLRRLVENRLRAALGPDVHVGGLHVVPALLRAEMDDVHLRSRSFDLDVPHIRLRLGYAALRGSLTIALLEIEAPRLTLRSSGAGTTSTGAMIPALLVRELLLTDGAFTYDGPASHLELGAIEMHGGIGVGSLELRTSGGRFLGDAPLELGPAQASLRATPHLDLDIERLTAQVGASSVSASGRVGSAFAPRLALTLDGQLALADAARLLGRSDLDGRLDVHARLDGPPAEAAIALEARSSQLTLAGWPARDVVLTAHRSGAPEAAVDADLSAAVAGGQAHVRARLSGEVLDASLDATRVDAEALRRGLAPDGAPLSGTGDLQARARGPLRGWLAVRVDAQTRLELAGQNVATRLHAEGSADTRNGNLDLRWSAANSSLPAQPGERLHGLDLEIAGTASGPFGTRVKGSFSGSADLTTATGIAPVPFEGQLHANGTAWTLEATAAPRGGQASLAAEARGTSFERLTLKLTSLQLDALMPDGQGTLQLDLDARGALATLDGSFSATGQDLVVAGTRAGAAQLDGRIEQGRVSFELALPELGTRLTGGLADGRVTAEAQVEQLPLERFAAVQEASAKGRLGGSAHLTAPLERPAAASVELTVNALQLERESWMLASSEPFRLHLRDGTLVLEPAHLTGSGLDLRAEGRANLETRILQGKLEGLAQLAELPSQTGRPQRGSVRADVGVSGDWARPILDGELTTHAVLVAVGSLPALQFDDTRAVLRERRLELPELVARVGGGTARLKARIPFAALAPAWRATPGLIAEDEAASFDLNFEDVDPSALGRTAEAPLPDSPDLQSRLAGNIALRGGLASLAELTGHLQIPATTVQLGETTLTTSDLDLALDSGHLGLSGVELKTPNGQLTVHGNVDLGHRELTASAKGAIELRALSPLLSEAALTGLADVDLEIRGPFDALRPRGTLEVEGGSLRLRVLGQAITGLRTLLAFEGGLLRIESLEGELGGGALSGSGQARLVKGGLGDVDVRLVGKDVALRYPVGMRSRLNTTLALTGRTGAFQVAGDIDVQRADYDLDAVLDTSLFAGTTRASRSPLLRSIGLELNIRLLNPARVASQRNGFDQVLARGELRVLGDMQAPLPYGALDLLPGGRLRFGDKPFRLEGGSLRYDGTWDARLDLNAQIQEPVQLTKEAAASCAVGAATADTKDTRVRIAAQASGTLTLPSLVFESTPSVGDSNAALSLLLTGSCGQDLAGSGGAVAGGQLAGVLSDKLTGRLRGGIGALGLDEVTIQPQLVANDQPPGARFTFGKRITPFTRLIYSTALNRPDDQYVRLEFGPWRTLTASAKRFSDGSLAATLGQRLEWGGARTRPTATPDERVTVESVELRGDLGAPESDVARALGIGSGQRLTEWRLLDRADALREWLRERGYLEAEVGAHFEGHVARVQVRSGPRYAWRVEGQESPPELGGVIRQALFEAEALDRGRNRLLRDLRRSGHLRAQVRPRVEVLDELRTLVFEVTPGPIVALLEPDIRGAQALSAGKLLKLAGGLRAVAAEPEHAAELWQQAYNEAHYFTAQIDGPRVLDVPGGVRVVARIDEGPAAHLASIEFEGASEADDALRAAAGLHAQEPLDEQRVADATLRLRNFYLGLGHPRVRILPELEQVEADLALRFRIDEGPRLSVREVRIEGAEHTRPGILLSRAGLIPGRPLDPRNIFAAERRLLSLGTISSAHGEFDEQGVVTMHVTEAPRFLTGYEITYGEVRGQQDNDANTRGFRAQIDGEVRNLLGRGLVLGGRYARGSSDDEARTFLNLPLRRNLFTLSASRVSEDFESLFGSTTRVQRELQAQQTVEFNRIWKLLVGYRFKRVTVAPLFPDPIDVAGLQPSLIRDTRDNQLDTRSGRFYSLNFEIDGTKLGSDSSFAKTLFQARVFSTHGAFTWAQGFQLGLGWGFGGRIRASERFLAGGPNSVRGFALDGLGGRDEFSGEPSGGDAVLVLNQELRWRHASGLGAAIFYDAGNVFDRWNDLNLDLRHSLGVGARYASPVGLLRLDLAFPLARRADEKSYRLIFSLGQAF